MDPTYNLIKGINKKYDTWLQIPQERIQTFTVTNQKTTLTQPQTQKKPVIDAFFMEPEAIVYANLDAIFGISSQSVDNNTLDYRLWHAGKRFVMCYDANGASEYFLWRNPNWYCASTPIPPANIWSNLDDKTRVLPIVKAKPTPDITVGVIHASPDFNLKLVNLLEHMYGEVSTLIIKVDDEGLIPTIGLLCGAFERVAVIAPYSRLVEDDRYVVLQQFRRETLAEVGEMLMKQKVVKGEYPELLSALKAKVPPRNVEQVDKLQVLAFWCIPSGGWKDFSRGR